jgi:hypothetical protein
MSRYTIEPVSYTKLDNTTIGGNYDQFLQMVKMINLGGTPTPSTPVFFYEYTNTGTDPIFIRAASIGYGPGGPEQLVIDDALQPTFWHYHKGVTVNNAFEQNVASGTQREMGYAQFRIFKQLGGSSGSADNWYPLPDGTRLEPNETYWFVWWYPLANYVSAAEFAARNNDMEGAYYFEIAECYTSTPDYPALKKKVLA